IRHAWATMMLRKGADIMTVSFLLGHESVKTTERYAKVSNEMARHIYESINN
ncbi:MAG: tyrosine-type recombinase/integrase, partial [Paludibacteraceae bacterium]|nr:tyrosine-type recombinase/integrase [Paludibacteraceae bacterium]